VTCRSRRAAGRKPWSRALTRPGAFGLGVASYGIAHALVLGAPWWLWLGWIVSLATVGAGVMVRRMLP
jgi:hypothetical protein